MDRPWLKSYPRGVPAQIDPQAFPSLAAMFEHSCERFHAHTAFSNLGSHLSFAEAERLSRQFAGYLQGLGLGKGDRVAVMLPNSLQYPVVLFGALRAGLVVVNVNPMYTPRELAFQLGNAGVRAVVVF